MRPKKIAVSVVIKDESGKFLIVKRPNNPNDELAGVWGFPAVTLRPDETEIEGCKRIGKTKLGVEIEISKRIGDGADKRQTYDLHLTDYEARILSGIPKVPQADNTVTQYEEYKFTDDPSTLFDAAKKGSVCTQVFLKSIGKNWGEL